MPEQQTTAQQTAIPAPTAPQAIATTETAIAEEWDEPIEELPPRPRRRLLGAGGNPVLLALLGVLLIACGFIAGVLVEKGQTSSSASSAGGAAAGLASRFAALRGASGAGSGTSAGASAAGGFAASGSRAGGSTTIGQVAYIDGDTLYVTDAEGNTVRVTTSPGAVVTKTVTADVKDVHPGETVVVTGAAGAHGAISAESIRVGTGAVRRRRGRWGGRPGTRWRWNRGRRRTRSVRRGRLANRTHPATPPTILRTPRSPPGGACVRRHDHRKGVSCLISTATDANPRRQP
jgi:hypothetical protein